MFICKLFLAILIIITELSFVEAKKQLSNQHLITKKPNIILITPDNYTTQAFGIYGGSIGAELHLTPTLDKIANEGVIFNNCFINNDIYTLRRAGILNGQDSQGNGRLYLDSTLPIEKQHHLGIYNLEKGLKEMNND